MKFLKKKKLIFSLLFSILLSAAVFIVSVYFSISFYSQKYIYNTIEDLPRRKVGLVLGTSPWFSDGSPNIFFEERMYAALLLYRTKKIEYVIVSGDNRTEKYNEPRMMKRFLVREGVPADKIIEDFAGLRTLDSVLRGLFVFGQKDMIIISQKFHNERAIFIARNTDIEAIGFNADSGLAPSSSLFKNFFREAGARIIAVYDVWVKTMPKFLGKMISI